MTVRMGTRTNQRWRRFSKLEGDPLLPGIPNEITFAQIATKLCWRDFYTLSSVSRAWCYAIRSRQIYDVRVRSHSTETLVLLAYVPSERINAMALYSMKDNCCYELPPIPYLARGIPEWCKCVALDGKLYILGDENENSLRDVGRVHVLDLAGQRKWKRCASMPGARDDFACGVLDGKIYVLGGVYGFDPVCGAQVYDPKENSWSSVKPMPSLRFQHQVATFGDKLFVLDGKVFAPEMFDSTGNRLAGYEYNIHETYQYTQNADSLEVYHPVNDEWTVVSSFRKQPDPVFMGKDLNEALFMARGKFYSLSPVGIHVYDSDRCSWAYLHSCSFTGIGPVDSITVTPNVVLALDGELLAIVDFANMEEKTSIAYLIRSRGFGSQNKEIVWQKAQIPPSFANWPVDLPNILMSAIEL